jgi:hypothetical protein
MKMASSPSDKKGFHNFEDAKPGEYFCKHCSQIFYSKYTFRRHLEDHSQPHKEIKDQNTIKASYVLEQYNTYTALKKHTLLYCSVCFKLFNNRQTKAKHTCSNIGINDDGKSAIDSDMAKLDTSFKLLTGQISDCSFKQGVTITDVVTEFGSDFIFMFLKTYDLSGLAIELFTSKNPFFNTIRWNAELKTFEIHEYNRWLIADQPFIEDEIFNSCRRILFAFYTFNKKQINAYFDEIKSYFTFEKWFCDIRDDVTNHRQQIEKQEIHIFLDSLKNTENDRFERNNVTTLQRSYSFE